ncbi:MAG TPA: zinc ribbon domain-containing protein [Desulfitobacteriaceae bacterium]|nr:zinc ribbon domain-containing protein [Desulfitobacteriaceae bacterium]
MPSYDLVCQGCGCKFSVFCAISKKEEQICPQCGSRNLGQRFTAVNIVKNVGAADKNPFAGSCGHGSCSSGFCPGSCDFPDLT